MREKKERIGREAEEGKGTAEERRDSPVTPRHREEAGVRVKAAEIEGEGSYSKGIMSVRRGGEGGAGGRETERERRRDETGRVRGREKEKRD